MEDDGWWCPRDGWTWVWGAPRFIVWIGGIAADPFVVSTPSWGMSAEDAALLSCVYVIILSRPSRSRYKGRRAHHLCRLRTSWNNNDNTKTGTTRCTSRAINNRYCKEWWEAGSKSARHTHTRLYSQQKWCTSSVLVWTSQIHLGFGPRIESDRYEKERP